MGQFLPALLIFIFVSVESDIYPEPMAGYEYITTQDALERAGRSLAGAPIVALDLECASGLHHYEKRVCLMQMATREAAYVIDALAGLELGPVRRILEDPAIEIVMHDADFDMRSLDREYGWRPRNIFDTLIAARLCGQRQFGLASMLERHFGVQSSKRFQRADWTIRPLPGDMLEYAACDVKYLVELRDMLEAELKRLDRIDWAVTKFAERELIRFEQDDRPAFARVKRAKPACDGRALAVLNELAHERERISKALDLPPFRVISDEPLIDLATNPPHDVEALKRRRGMHPHCRRGAADALFAAIQRGKAGPKLAWPAPPRKKRRAFHSEEIMEAIKSWRAKEAQEHDLEPDLILSMRSIKALAQGGSLEDVMRDEASTAWGGGKIKESLARLLTDCRTRR